MINILKTNTTEIISNEVCITLKVKTRDQSLISDVLEEWASAYNLYFKSTDDGRYVNNTMRIILGLKPGGTYSGFTLLLVDDFNDNEVCEPAQPYLYTIAKCIYNVIPIIDGFFDSNERQYFAQEPGVRGIYLEFEQIFKNMVMDKINKRMVLLDWDKESC